MPAYIGVKPTRKNRKDGANIIDEPNLFVDVFIGKDILDPFQTLVDCLEETHNENIEMEDTGSMMRHRREEPKCSYCAAIRDGKKTLRAIKGRAL